MPETTLTIRTADGGEAGTVELKSDWLEFEKGRQAVHDAVVAHLAARRSGTACTKTRAAVRGGGAKPFRQKGTGRARAGSTRSPLWRGGGVIFGPHPRSYAKKLNKKVRRLALKRAFSDRVAEGDVVVVDEFVLDAPRTREAANLLEKLGIGEHVLIIVDKMTDNLRLATRNLPNVFAVDAAGAHTYQLLYYRKLLFTKAGLDAFTGGRLTSREKTS
ncbi:MAG: 50S ribosomal protein L4 [Kiritimatiellaeota bacterium]|nr:50S ribosomal protein L4 [Kiritimatiellota bacterium]